MTTYSETRSMPEGLHDFFRQLGGWAYAGAGAFVTLVIAWWKRRDSIDSRLERMQDRWREELRDELKVVKDERGYLELAVRILSNEVERLSPGNPMVIKIQTILAFQGHKQMPVELQEELASIDRAQTERDAVR